jgi:hypothetical protein
MASVPASIPGHVIPCILGSVVLLLARPAAATLVLSHASLAPQGLPLSPLQDLGVDARIAIIPSGARTFAIGHSLQLETDLAGARWSTGVLVDGIPADREGGTGRVVFLSGFVLSYPTYRDVALEVSVEGTVPRDAGPDITVLTIKELDNQGMPVPGSTITIAEPVAAPASPPAPVPTTAPPAPETSPVLPSPTKAGGGCGWPAVLLAAAAPIIIRLFRYGRM